MDLQSKGDSGRRQSDEPAPAKESVDNISAMNTLEFLARTVRAQHENGELTDEHRAGFLDGLENALNTAEFISGDAPNVVTRVST